jgi:hypothetical protein
VVRQVPSHASFDEGRPMTMLVCPACGQIHVDEGSFATKPHRTHRCVRGPYGVGCEHEWDAPEKCIGTDELALAYERGLDRSAEAIARAVEFALVVFKEDYESADALVTMARDTLHDLGVDPYGPPASNHKDVSDG